MITDKREIPTGWIDISIPIRGGMVASRNDIKVQIERRRSIEGGDRANNSAIHMGVHASTHMDAPRHVFANGKSIDQMPLVAGIGPARVIEIVDNVSIKAEELKRCNIKHGERILFKTRNSQRSWQNDTFESSDYVYITREAAHFLADAGVMLIGIDYLSVGGAAEDHDGLPDTHQILLGAEIWILEGIDLSRVGAGHYNLICLPLKLVETDGSPIRAALQPIL